MNKRTYHMRLSGPYRVYSLASGAMKVVPDWPQFPKWTADEGGGPGLLSRLALAEDMERFLNGGKRHDEIEAKAE